MNLQEASRYLSCFRDGRPLEKPVRKAAAMAASDATLRDKLAAQVAFDAQICAVVRSIEPPENLGAKLSEKLVACARPAGTLRSQIFHPAILAVICGGLLILGFLIWGQLDRMEAFPGKESIVKMVGVAKVMDGAELDPTRLLAGELGDAFYIHGFEGFELPDDLARMRAVGSRVFKQNTHPIAQIALDPHDALLYVFRAADFGVSALPPKKWTLFTQDDWVAAVRERNGLCHVVTFRGERPEMERFLHTLLR